MSDRTEKSCTFETIASRGLGLWHERQRPDGRKRFYRYFRRLGYVRVPRVITPWRSTEEKEKHKDTSATGGAEASSE